MSFASLLLDAAKHAVSGSAAGSVAMAVVYPIDLIRTSQMIARERVSMLETARRLMRDGGGGPRALYRGLPSVLAALSVSNLVYFWLYALLRSAALKRRGSLPPGLNSALALVAGCANVLLTSPLWVAATRIKLRAPDESSGAGLWRVMLGIARSEGVGALWRGTLASLMLVCAPTVQMVFYDQLKSHLLARGAAPSARLFFALGGLSKLVSTLTTYPLQLLQTRMRQSQQSMMQTLAALLRDEGPLALYRGVESKLVQTILMSALHFVLYEWLARAVLQAKQRLLVSR